MGRLINGILWRLGIFVIFENLDAKMTLGTLGTVKIFVLFKNLGAIGALGTLGTLRPPHTQNFPPQLDT